MSKASLRPTSSKTDALNRQLFSIWMRLGRLSFGEDPFADSAVAVAVVIMVMVMVMIAPMVVIVVILVTTLIASLVAVLFIPGTRPFQFATPRQFLFAVTLGRGSAGVPLLIFCGPDEVNGPVTGIVFVAMQPPRVSVFGRNMQVEGLDDNVRRRRLYDHGTREDYRRRGALAQVHATVNARNDLSPDSDAEIQVTGMRDLTQRAG
jgi:hypothetical protein